MFYTINYDTFSRNYQITLQGSYSYYYYVGETFVDENQDYFLFSKCWFNITELPLVVKYFYFFYSTL